MLVPLSWLRDFAAFDLDPTELGRVFDSLGMVVEGIQRIGEGLDRVVVGRVLDVTPIEGARVRRTLVDIGGAEPEQIVCGADNVGAGQLVAVARLGAVLPGDFVIERRKVRGVWSNGMICSARELRLGEDAAGIMVLAGVPNGPSNHGEGEPGPLGGEDGTVALGTPFALAMGIEADVVYDLAIETNRPDANSMAGVARDAAAKLGIAFALPPARDVERTGPAARPVAVEAPELCPRFTATVLDGVRVGPSPSWLARRLTLAGMRPISNLVDISNYVMLERGQPTHPYDLDKLAGRTFGVRAARPGETVVTLDGAERRLGLGASPDCLICDGDDVAVGIAGVMGGASSEIDDATTAVLLEAAHFERYAVARTSKRLALRSEASARFERGVDPLGIEAAVARFVELATDLAGAEAGPTLVVEYSGHIPYRRPITVRTAKVNALLGTHLDDGDIDRLLAPIEYLSRPVAPGVREVTPPSFRLDSEIEEDVIEEVARHHGYDRIPLTVPRPAQVGRLTAYQRERRSVRDVLAGLGLTEALTGLLVAPGDHERAGLDESDGAVVTATDPSAKEESVLRASLRPGLLKAVAFNLSKRLDEARLFELGHTFPPPTPDTAPRPDEHEWLTIAVAAANGAADAREATRVWLGLADALRLEDVDLVARGDEPGMHPTRTAALSVDGRQVGVVGEIDPAVAAAFGIDTRVGVVELLFEALAELPRRSDEQKPISRYPSSDIDLAFWVDEPVPAAAVEHVLVAAGGDLLEWARLFDVYQGPGTPDRRRGLAYRLRFVALDRTLTDAELAGARRRCIDAVESALAATLR